jgi:hypothetical protein
VQPTLRSSATVESPRHEEIVDSEQAVVAVSETFSGGESGDHANTVTVLPTVDDDPGSKLSPATVPGVWPQLKSVLFSESTLKPALDNVLAAVPAGSPITFGTVIWLVTSKVTCP